MTRTLIAQWILLWFLAAMQAAGAAPCLACCDETAKIQVLGSGGPVPDIDRASSGYLLWLDGHARALIDAGGGTFLRYSQSGAQFADLWFVGLSHFHADHAAELPAFLKGSYFSTRETALKVAGPGESQRFPGLHEFLAGLFDAERGSFRYLAGFMSGQEAFRLEPLQVDHTSGKTHIVYQGHGLTVSALGVPHGIVPALAFRLELGKHSVVFGSDQNGSDDRFIEFAKEADLLVMHMAIPEDAGGTARRLHARPSRIGEIADAAGAKELLLSHFMRRSQIPLQAGLAALRRHYSGRLILAEDLMTIDLGCNQPVDKKLTG